MKHCISTALLLAVSLLAGGCTDDELEYVSELNGPEQAGDSPLQFAVDPYTLGTQPDARAAEPSPVPEPESEAEKAIRDFWLFQFNTDGTQLAAPVYYSIPDPNPDNKTLTDLTKAAYGNLKKNTPMTIYIVTNTGNATWANDAGFNTLNALKKQKLPAPFSIQAGFDGDNDGKADDIYIPMAGQLDNVTVSDNSMITVPVTRMYAKIKIQVGFKESSMNLYYADITGIPWYCKVSPLSDGTTDAAVPFPADTRMISRAFKSDEAVADEDGNKWLVLYMPENIRGEVDGVDKTTTGSGATTGNPIPENALKVSIRSKYMGEDYYYTVYPGENSVNNFNVRRNRVYRVSIDVRKITDQHNPSSNCYVVKPGEMLSFEPYNRAEKGGGYDIRTYLDPNVTSKRIHHVGIIWQTKDCIGDNSKGDLVTWEANEASPLDSKLVIKKTGVEGNALVGAYNSSGKIIWSWHIWVTPNEPDNIANAIIYTTYRWDNKGIHHTEPRIPGYGIMPCNIGALAFRSDDDMPYKPIWINWYTIEPHYSIPNGTKFPDSQIRTFGMLYQWGRKDPFPPMIYSTGVEDGNGTLSYTNEYTEEHVANDNRTVVNKTSSDESSYLFHSVDGGQSVEYSIGHPTIYIRSYSTDIIKNDWCIPADDRLWGATESSTVEYSIPDSNNKAHLRNNYGTKSIFDPCPAGWRVAPGDLWLGFTKDGLNPTNYENDVNYSKEDSGKRPGMSMYVQAFQSGPTTYFPLQGTRTGSGSCGNTGLCGNYHNATCDDEGRVNLLHLHRNMAIASQNNKSLMLFKLFEYKEEKYYAKSTAGPIRCVRDSK